MGQSKSLLTEEEKAKQEAENFVYDTRYMSWDDKGNLRYGLVHPVKRLQQKLDILQMDFVDDEDGKLWYIMDSAWIASWLAYVHFDMQNAPAPGPCYNHRLITYDYADKKYVFRFALQMATQDRGGDYRRVSPDVWKKFLEFYPNSGPAITMVFNGKDKKNDGFYSPDLFTIVDAVPPPADANDDEKANKKKKRKLFAFKKKKEAEEKAAKEKEEKLALKQASKKLSDEKNAISSDGNAANNNNQQSQAVNRLRDSDDDDDDDDSTPASKSLLLKTNGKTNHTELRTKDSDDDSDDERLTTTTTTGRSSSAVQQQQQGNLASLMKASTKVEPKTVSGGYTRVTESATGSETKDDAYYEKIYLS